MHILLVDDAPDIQQTYSLALRLRGHSIDLAENGVEALQAVALTRFDAIIMDVEMPIMDGLETTRKVRMLPHGQSVPIVMVTGYNYDRSVALEAGANELVYKPIDADKLISLLERLQSA